MFEEKSHISLRLCLFAMVMLVMTCVGMTILIDNWAERHELEENVSEQRRKIMELEKVARSFRAKQAGVDFQVEVDRDQLAVMETQKHVLLASLTNLRSDRRDAAAEVESVEKEFGTYREKARKLIWSRSVGYRFGSLTIEYDRTYEGVRISRISEHGVEIAHDGGTSFIPSNNMPPSLQEKFQLILATPTENTLAPPNATDR